MPVSLHLHRAGATTVRSASDALKCPRFETQSDICSHKRGMSPALRLVRFIRRIAAISVAAASLAHAQSQPSPQAGQPNRVLIDYVTPQNPDLRGLYDALKAHGALEKIQKILSPLRLPEPLVVKTTECAKVNASYRREGRVPTVVICYELLQQVLDSLPKDTTPEGVTADDAKVGQVLYLTLHEVGHAVFDIFDVPVFGQEEDAADSFATYILLQFAEARRLVGGAAWAWSAYMRNYKMNPTIRLRLTAFADNHGLPQERFYNLACLAFGSNPVKFAVLAEKDYLPPGRSLRCAYEYARLARAFKKEIGPHIDYELAKSVTEARWLQEPETKAK